MATIKTISLFILGFVFGFGLWYLIFWFVTNEPNLFMWHWITKVVYLFFGFSSTTGILKALLED